MSIATVDKTCRGCVYLHVQDNEPLLCGYILAEQKRRGCPAGKGCVQKNTRRKRRVAPQVLAAARAAHQLKPEAHARRLELYHQGYSDYRIGRIVGVTGSVIQAWRKKYKLPSNFVGNSRRSKDAVTEDEDH